MLNKTWEEHNKEVGRKTMPPSKPMEVALEYWRAKGKEAALEYWKTKRLELRGDDVVGGLDGSRRLMGGSWFPGPGGVEWLQAADLGCGVGIDSFALLDEGFRVLAIDKDEGTISRLNHNYAISHSSMPPDRLVTSIQAFEQLNLPSVHWVNASFALPFCRPERFSACWEVIRQAIGPHGLFSGHFIGSRDTWAQRADMTILERGAIVHLLKGFELVWMEETEKDGTTLGGASKHWHVFSLVAVKKGA